MTTPAISEFLLLQEALAGRYSLERELGRGGMGIVFLARDVALDRPVAIKLLPPELAQSPDLRERFLREARTAAKFSHPNIVPIHLVETRDNLVYFVMAFVDGETLGQRVRRAGALGAPQATRVIQEVAWALAYAHGRGVVHRDVKPDNILLDKDTGRAMVTDFGIAHIASASPMTGAGELIGTAHYMSPEALSGRDVDGRSDLFSLGVTAYYGLTAHLPFDGPTLPAVIARILTEEPARLVPQRAGIPPRLAEAVERCLAKDPAARFASGEELAEAVGAAAGGGAETPPQIRYLLKLAREVDTAFGLAFVATVLLPGLFSALWATKKELVLLVSFVFAAQFIGVPFMLVRGMRETIKAGLGYPDLQRALERARLASREEAEALGGTDSAADVAKRRKEWRVLGHGTVAAGVLGILATRVFGAGPRNWVIAASIAVLSVGVMSYVASLALRMFKVENLTKVNTTSQVGEWLLRTRVGKWLFRLAGIGLSSQSQGESPSAQPTEVVLALAAGDVFKRLSPELRQRFEEVPEIVGRLEHEAEKLRQREVVLGRAAASAEPASHRAQAVTGDLEIQRAATRARLATAVAALESIRLDLLKLESGMGSADDLTAALERAREVGQAVDRELQAGREVRELLSETT